jgi:tetratricopeptide (TPR) repeat protein
MAKKSKQRSKRKSSQKAPASMPRALLDGLIEAQELIEQKEWLEAREILLALDRRYPNRSEVLTELVLLAHEMKNNQELLRYIQQLAKVQPNDPSTMLTLANAYMVNLFPAIAIQTYRRFLARHPNDPDADQARKDLALLESNMGQILSELFEEMNLSEEEGLALAAQNDQVRALFETNQFSEARQAAKRLLEHYPDFIPALNNLSQLDFFDGQIEQAIATARRVLALEPDNFQALGNLARFLYLSGQAEEGRQLAERFKSVESVNPDIWLKKMETLSYLGDDQGVLAALQGVEQAGYLAQNPQEALIYHLAGVAAARLGDEKQARQYWRKSLKLGSGFALAQENLTDLKKPVEERHGAWAFLMAQWLSPRAVEELIRHMQPAVQRGTDEALNRAVCRFLKSYPESIHRVPLLLERGDPVGRGLAFSIAMSAEVPELLTALRDFALSQNGPDSLRYQAAQIVMKAGLLPSGPTRLWIRGEWREILLIGFELYQTQNNQHSPQVTRWLIEGIEALNRDETGKAEALFKRALEVEPDAPDILNNLGATYDRQGRRTEAEAILQKIYQEYPDYFFGIVGMANSHTVRGETEQARALLDPLLSRSRLHFSEFASLCTAYIQLFLAEGNAEGARTWLDMWANADPDNPNLVYWRGRVKAAAIPGASGLQALGKMFRSVRSLAGPRRETP